MLLVTGDPIGRSQSSFVVEKKHNLLSINNNHQLNCNPTPQTVTSKNSRRRIHLLGQSNKAIEVTLWGETPVNFDESGLNTIVTFYGLKMSQFRGLSLSVHGEKTLYQGEIRSQCRNQLIKWWANNINKNRICFYLNTRMKDRLDVSIGLSSNNNDINNNINNVCSSYRNVRTQSSQNKNNNYGTNVQNRLEEQKDESSILHLSISQVMYKVTRIQLIIQMVNM